MDLTYNIQNSIFGSQYEDFMKSRWALCIVGLFSILSKTNNVLTAVLTPFVLIAFLIFIGFSIHMLYT